MKALNHSEHNCRLCSKKFTFDNKLTPSVSVLLCFLRNLPEPNVRCTPELGEAAKASSEQKIPYSILHVHRVLKPQEIPQSQSQQESLTVPGSEVSMVSVSSAVSQAQPPCTRNPSQPHVAQPGL
ncbi:hypothetical protein GH733_000474 [Mirounga leonina]|nr:hypothetical protein GH733_000474 [Mirounga leonina]